MTRVNINITVAIVQAAITTRNLDFLGVGVVMKLLVGLWKD
jgi:hypothetical protein